MVDENARAPGLCTVLLGLNLEMKVSIIIPCHNAIGKIERCLASLRKQTMPVGEYEVIFVDDCSSDGTADYLLRQTEVVDGTRWRVIRRVSNSGSPSEPRNMGVDAARGEYIFYLDCDDEILPDTLERHTRQAIDQDLCVLRGYLRVFDGSSFTDANRIKGFSAGMPKKSIIEGIIRQQSTTVPSLIRRSLLVSKGIRWDPVLRMGEDTLYLIDVLLAAKRIGYIDHPTFVYNKVATRIASSTRQYGARELRNHLRVWQSADAKLKTIGLSYVSMRLQVGLQTALLSLIKFNRWDIDESLFGDFSVFINEHWSAIEKFNYGTRLKDLVKSIRAGDFSVFKEQVKPRLLVAGYGLQFIEKALPGLSEYFSIRIDEWTGHATHDLARSKECLDWAEVIFCEWLLGNAVWYSNNKRPDQKLIVRAHRFELARDLGNRVNDAAVDLYIAVSLFYFEMLIERFGYARKKIRLVPNYINLDSYASNDDPARVFNLAIIGTLPSRKGYLRSLELLKALVELDSRYNLSVYGKSYSDTSWTTRNQEEDAYFEECQNYLERNGLASHVHQKGYSDLTVALSNTGFVLSVSDDSELPESFHIAPADGFAAGAQGVFLDWRGVEYIYQSETVFPDLDAIKAHIVEHQDYSRFKEAALRGRNFLRENYTMSAFVSRFRREVADLF